MLVGAADIKEPIAGILVVRDWKSAGFISFLASPNKAAEPPMACVGVTPSDEVRFFTNGFDPTEVFATTASVTGA